MFEVPFPGGLCGADGVGAVVGDLNGLNLPGLNAVNSTGRSALPRCVPARTAIGSLPQKPRLPSTKLCLFGSFKCVTWAKPNPQRQRAEGHQPHQNNGEVSNSLALNSKRYVWIGCGPIACNRCDRSSSQLTVCQASSRLPSLSIIWLLRNSESPITTIRAVICIDAFQGIAPPPRLRAGRPDVRAWVVCRRCFGEIPVGFALRAGLDQRIHLLLGGQWIGAGQGLMVRGRSRRTGNCSRCKVCTTG